MNLRSTTIEGKSKDIISEDELKSKWELYTENRSMQNATAVEVSYENKDYILPLRNKTDGRPGLYPSGSVYFLKFPDKKDESYDKDKLSIIDFSDISTVNEYFEKHSQLREMESNSLTDSTEVYKPVYSGHESAEMKAMKDAICCKNMDLNKYAPRFGDNFLNEKRLLRGDGITMNKLISISNAIDIEAELILRNANPDVANPMDREIHVILTKGNNNDE